MANKLEKTVLHVDDDPSVLRLVSKILTDRGYSVVSVSDPNLAIDTLREVSARLVILDIDMPERSGLSVLEEIKAIDGSIQVLMLTGLVTMATICRATQLGAEEVQFKPIQDFEELVNAVDRAYEKMLRWWRTLREWKKRHNKACNTSTSGDSIQQYIFSIDSLVKGESAGGTQHT